MLIPFQYLHLLKNRTLIAVKIFFSISISLNVKTYLPIFVSDNKFLFYNVPVFLDKSSLLPHIC